ncbi:hypothetical protein EYZ11_009859 [Aspergillus tanneri]|uniref:S-adenosyl-L-methionine-dependent methyltransferase n=1 Tax=Aspergillus tanneri TaxID=1220188 RepID=A0A4V3UNC8_9EURO|nr:hypothetical protein EYZ11_009859 [Aspergillus tanneri]
MTSPERVLNAEGQTRLVRHFQDQISEIESHAAGWSNLWDTDNSNLWDRGKPSPALIDLIEERRDLFYPLTETGKKKKALVPGCGKGYDVVMLALHGFDVYGLDVSATGVAIAREYAKAELATPQAYNFGKAWNSVESEGQATGEVTFIEGDFFQSDWETEGQFDLIYDYTFLCALHPSMRPRWASRMGELISPIGMLVCLEFPMYQDPKLPGPPWGLKGVHWNLLAEGGCGTVSDKGDDGLRNQGKAQFRRVFPVQDSCM